MSRKPISKGLRFDVFNRDKFRCQYCGATSKFVELHVDHKMPVALGGTNDFDNLITACAPCNIGKRTKLANLEQDIDWEGVPCPFADGWPNDIEDPVYYLNQTWAVTDYGMERVAKFYAIGASDLGVRHPSDKRLGNWLDHLSTKRWVMPNIDQTIAAYLRALEVHQIDPDFDMQYTLATVRSRVNELQILDKHNSPSIFDLNDFEEHDA